MAGVVILVVTFLAGVQVGRGVLAQRGLPDSTLAAADDSEPAPPPASATPGTTQAPVTANEKLSYAERLGSSEPAAEQLRKAGAPPIPAADNTPAPKPEVPAPAKPAPAKTTPPATTTAPAPAPAAAAPAPTTPEPSGSGFAIQVAALKEVSEADAIVKRLASKGYPAYVVAPAKGAPAMYRVRVGKYKDRREADTVAARLQKEEQFKPWVVR